MHKLSSKKTKKRMAHDDVTCGGMARKVLKINGLAIRFEITPEILMTRPRKSRRNSAIHFRICSYFATYCLWLRFRHCDGHQLEIFRLPSIIGQGEMEVKISHGFIDTLLKMNLTHGRLNKFRHMYRNNNEYFRF